MALTIADLWTVEKDAFMFADVFVQITINFTVEQILIVLINNKKIGKNLIGIQN